MNHSIRFFVIISIMTFIAAFFFFGIYNQLILFYHPQLSLSEFHSLETTQKKQVTFYYFHGDKWKTEKQEMLWSDNNEKNIFQLINAWLTLLEEEHIFAKKITLQSVLISSGNCAYLSFDNNMLGKQDTIFKKWMILEGLLKTIRDNNSAITQMQFLVNHKIVHDAHLDFSLPWPIHGFA